MGRKKISAYDAKTHLGQLLRDAQGGQAFLITRRGTPVARLEPVETEAETDLSAILDEFRKVRARVRAKLDVRGLIREGRRR